MLRCGRERATLGLVHARAALFDLYGDHLAERGHWAPISGIVRLLGAVDVAPAAVRTAVSRMVREGWLEPRETAGCRGYAASPRAQARLAEAHVRIYRTEPAPWDGCWHVVVVDHPADRAARTKAAATMGFLGYARLAADTWVAPRPGAGLAAALATEGTAYRGFVSRFDGAGTALAATLWDLEGLGAAYRRFVEQAGELTRELGTGDVAPATAFAARTRVVHEWRKFLFRDPGLPEEVLPEGWPGQEAAGVFTDLAERLLPAARAFVDGCVQPDGREGR